MTAMRVLHVHWAALPVTGGVETHLHALVGAQRAQGLSADLLAGTPDAVAAGFSPLLEPGGAGGPAELDALVATAARADVLHWHNPQWHRPDVTRAVLDRLDTTGWSGACVLDVHNLADRDDHWSALAELGRPLAAHSAFVAGELGRVGAGEPVVVLPLALPVDEPGPDDPLGGPGVGPVVLQPTRLSAWKGSQHSLTAALDLLDAGREFTFVHAGVGNLLWDPGLPDGLLERAEVWRRRGRVRFVHYPPELSWQALRSADLVVHPTAGQGARGEPYSMSVAQAVVLGKPVLATSSGNLPELLRDHPSGTVVPPDDPAALTAALVRFLDGHWPGLGAPSPASRRVAEWHAGAAATHAQLYERLTARERALR
jgi:glycosyltransferase involved in cell wall biosynthesis